MRTRAFLTLGVFAVSGLASLPASAQIEPRLAVPENLPMSLRVLLNTERGDLGRELAQQLQPKAAAFNKKCGSVDKKSGLVADCQSDRDGLEGMRLNFNARVVDFNKRVRFAEQFGCPPTSKPDAENATEFTCRCNEGFGWVHEASRSECRPAAGDIVVLSTIKIQKRFDLTKAATPRAGCIRMAGYQLQIDLAACKPSIVTCLTKEGVQEDAAECTFAGLTAAISTAVAAADPTKLAVTGAATSVGAALVKCRKGARSITTSCGPTWGACQELSLKTHAANLAACPNQ